MKLKKSIFFLKTPKAPATASNSVNLRFKLAATGKYKVKGLGITCTTQDWNQEKQIIKDSHSQFEKHNKQLKFISDELALIEKERNVTASDIDTIVEASIKECTVEELDNRKKLLYTMVVNFANHMEKNGSYSQHYQRRMESVGKILLKFEKAVKYQIDAALLEKSLMHTQEDIIEFFRKKKAKDSTIKAFLTNLNAAISHYNKYSESPIKTFNKRAERWVKEEKQIVALTKDELKKLYDLVFNPKPSAILKPNPVELRNLKFFLFRCFCGMRVGDMHLGNINPKQLTKDSKTFTYRQGKVNKHATVTCINTYLYDIAESLDWKFPSEVRHKSINSYSYRETLHVRKFTGRLFADNMRQIEHNKNKVRSYTNLSDEISTHTPRKTFAHLLYNITNDVMRVKKELGHTKIETTMRYLDFLLDEESANLKEVDVFK